ncbi:MAG: alpha/beta fold hydrolase [Neisseriaceae bacterium]|nr:alpha/beta fold hydrolase [Neisseriaceae bacterium]
MNTQNHQFQFKQNFIVNVKVYTPDDNIKIKKSVILTGAIGVNLEKYLKFIEELTKLGYQVVTANYPGTWDNTPKVGRKYDYGYSDLVEEFIPGLIEYLRVEDRDNPIIVGHSLGAQVGTFYAVRNQASIISIASAHVYHKTYAGTMWENKIQRTGPIFKTLIFLYGYLPGYKFNFGHKEAAKLIKDWIKMVSSPDISHIVGDNYPKPNRNNYYVNIKGDEWAPLQGTELLASYLNNPNIT